MRTTKPRAGFTLAAVAALAAMLSAPAAADPGHVAQAVEGPLTWSAAEPHPFPRSEALGAAVGGKLYVIGGYDLEDRSPSSVDRSPRATPRVDVFDGATGTWSARKPMPQPLTHTPVVVDGRDIWLVGGFEGDSPGGAVTNTWRYETDNDRWTAGPPLPVARGAGGAAIVGRTIHFFGGVIRPRGSESLNDEGDHWALDLDDPQPAWEVRADMPGPRNHLAGAGLGGLVYAIGGQQGGNQTTGNSERVDVYDPARNTWSPAPDLVPGRGHINAAVFTANGQIWVVGGTEDDGSVRNGRASTAVTAFDPLNPAAGWRAHTPLPEGRKNPVAGHLGARVAVSTGYGLERDPTGFRDSTWTAAHQRGDEPALPPPGAARAPIGLPAPLRAPVSAPGGSGPTPSGASGTAELPGARGLRLSVRSVTASRGQARVRISCTGGAAARGRVVARTTAGSRVTLVRRSFRCRAGSSVTVRARLSPAARRALGRRGGLRVRVSVTARDGRGSTARSTTTLVVRG
jgi:hypothetical protein